MSILAKDYMCFILCWGAIEQLWKLTPGGFDNGDISSVIERVASDVLDELDYELEAKNGERFEQSLAFLGFVSTPIAVPEMTTKKASLSRAHTVPVCPRHPVPSPH